MRAELIPEKYAILMSPEDRRALGIHTNEERMAKFVARTERQLQRQIVQYLRLRGIEVIWHATNRKSTASRGTPDILFAVMVQGFPREIALEIKFGTGTCSRVQNDMQARLKTRPNAWDVRVISTFIQVVDFMREMNL